MKFPAVPRLSGVRAQLILGVALVHALLMSLFVWDLTQRQQERLLERQEEQAQALAHSLAVSGAVWLAARDLAGLQEIVEAQRDYPELAFALFTDRQGQVLAHSQPTRVGSFVTDLPAILEMTLLNRNAALVDLAYPMTLGGREIGWARVGIGQSQANAQARQLVIEGILYALAAILLGSLLALWLGNRLTRKLYAIRAVADGISEGVRDRRVPDLGHDEAAILARDFNAMLDALDHRDEDLAKTSRELAERENRLRTLVNTLPDLVWLKDPAGVYLACNPRFEKFFGATEARIVGHTDYDFVSRETADAFRAHDRLAVSRGAPSINEEWVTFADDGHRELLETIKTPLRDGAGNLVGVLGVGRDITARKRSEDLQRYAAFQAGVAEMGVSVLHNVGNAITSVSGDADNLRQCGDDLARLADLLRQSARDSEARLANGGELADEMPRLLAVQREAATAIEQIGGKRLADRGRRIAASVRHIADIIRIQQSAALPSASASTFDLGNAIQDALAMLGETLRHHGIAVEVDLPADPGTVTLPRNQLLQALINVLKNAYESIRQHQAAGHAGGRIRLRVEPLGPDRLRLTVSDNGMGITAEQQTRLFKYGYSSKPDGHGFGLHATALFVQEIGGTIRLEGQGTGQGAILSMELPRHFSPQPGGSAMAGGGDRDGPPSAAPPASETP